MKIARLVPVAALFVLPFVTGPASAGKCAFVPAPGIGGGVTACVDHNGCLVYESAGGPSWTQFSPICL